MRSHTIPRSAIRALEFLVGTRVDQLVWDVNAIYLVGPTSTTKIEAVSSAAESPSPTQFDEVFPIEVKVASSTSATFKVEGEPDLAYQVLAEAVAIIAIQVVRVGVEFPQDRVVHPSLLSTAREGANFVDCGVVIDTEDGALAAFQRHPGFGFVLPQKLLPLEQAILLLPPEYQCIRLENAA